MNFKKGKARFGFRTWYSGCSSHEAGLSPFVTCKRLLESSFNGLNEVEQYILIQRPSAVKVKMPLSLIKYYAIRTEEL
jgi:hypothetical protein